MSLLWTANRSIKPQKDKQSESRKERGQHSHVNKNHLVHRLPYHEISHFFREALRKLAFQMATSRASAVQALVSTIG